MVRTMCPHCKKYCNGEIETYGVYMHVIEHDYRPHCDITITAAWENRGSGRLIKDRSRLDDLLFSLHVDVNSGELTI